MNIIDRIQLPYDRLLGLLLVKELDPEAVSEGGIVIPDEAQEGRLVCEVLKLGPEVGWVLFGRDAKQMPPTDPGVPGVGDLVTVGRHSLRAADLKGLGRGHAEKGALTRTHSVNASDVLVIVKKEKSSG